MSKRELAADVLLQEAAHWIDVAIANVHKVPLVSVGAEWTAYVKLERASAILAGEVDP